MLMKGILIFYLFGQAFCSPETPLFRAKPLEDALADIPELIAKNGYPIETHKVVTEDGYILQVHRIPHGVNESLVNHTRPVVFLFHALLSSSADWVITGPENALAYIFADQGYDVWLGNARGNYYSRNHTTLDPDNDSEFWNFSWHEMAVYDLPAMIDLALNISGAGTLQYVGHSQGCTSFFAMAASKPEIKNKISFMHALAPDVYFTNDGGSIVEVLEKYGLLEIFSSLVGPTEILSRSESTANIAHTYCGQYNPSQLLCIKLLNEFVGTSNQYNKKLLPLILSHTPAGSSTKQFMHFHQVHSADVFQQYDYGNETNLVIYGTLKPPVYDLGLIEVPVMIWYGKTDSTINPIDLDRVIKELGNGIGIRYVDADIFNHLDFVWGTKAPTLVYEPLINIMNQFV